jgi:hypothetical protein
VKRRHARPYAAALEPTTRVGLDDAGVLTGLCERRYEAFYAPADGRL